jgi:hypothetical protein
VLAALGLFQAAASGAELPVTVDAAADPARAAALRNQAGTLREAAEDRFDGENAACYRRFLVNHCIDQARARRLEGIRKARALDLDADHLDLADKNRRYDVHQAEKAADAAKASVERAEQEARARADNEARMQQFAHEEAERTRRAQEGKTAAVNATIARSQHDADEARRRADEAAEAAVRAEKAAQDRASYAEREAEHTKKMAEKAAKKQADEAAGKPSGGMQALP